MNKTDYICICHRVSLGKLSSYVQRENPKYASQLSQCLEAGTSCGWCIPFLKQIHKQHQDGKTIEISLGSKEYSRLRNIYKNKK